MPLTQDRNTARRSGLDFDFPMSVGTIYAGSIVVITSSGLAEAGSTNDEVTSLGVAKAGAICLVDGETSISVEKGLHRFANSAAGDEVTLIDVGNDAFIVDDETVAKTDGTSTRSIAGKIEDVDEFGVWIRF